MLTLRHINGGDHNSNTQVFFCLNCSPFYSCPDLFKSLYKKGNYFFSKLLLLFLTLTPYKYYKSSTYMCFIIDQLLPCFIPFTIKIRELKKNFPLLKKFPVKTYKLEEEYLNR